MTGRYYVGFAATLHDPALAIMNDTGKPLFAEATERYLQTKRAYNCAPGDMVRAPRLLAAYCKPDAAIICAHSWSFQQLAALEAMSASWYGEELSWSRDIDDPNWPYPDPAALAVGLRNSLSQASLNVRSVRQIANPLDTRYYDHHLTHAAHAVFTSSFKECAVAIVDGFGEARSAAFYQWDSGRLSPLLGPPRPALLPRPASLGAFYGRVCALCGFDPILGEEWKVMGLASYASVDPQLYELLRPIVTVNGLELIQGVSDDELVSRLAEIRERIGFPHSPIIERASLARSGQAVFEDLMTELLTNLHARAASDYLALAGGCALNSSYNGKILARTPFLALHVPSAPGDDGTALGAAFLAFLEDHAANWRPSDVQTPYLGSSLSSAGVSSLLRFSGGYRISMLESEALCDRVAELVAQGNIVGWIQGRAEFGPRALGNRSILADPRRAGMRDRINTEVKFREEFRPLAPSILDEYGPDWFIDYQRSPYMDRALHFRPEVAGRVPAVVHVDGTGRLQSVTRRMNPRFHNLIERFHARTGVPLVVNTSYNVMGRPIVHSVEDVLGMFLTTGLDVVALDDLLVEKLPA
jgi:carbamoyltransferase